MLDLRKNLKPYYDELKKQGVIPDYQIQIKSTAESENDWQVALMFQYKNYAALDDSTAKADPISLKIYGSAEARREATAKHLEISTTVSSYLTRQIKMKDLPRWRKRSFKELVMNLAPEKRNVYSPNQ